MHTKTILSNSPSTTMNCLKIALSSAVILGIFSIVFKQFNIPNCSMYCIQGSIVSFSITLITLSVINTTKKSKIASQILRKIDPVQALPTQLDSCLVSTIQIQQTRKDKFHINNELFQAAANHDPISLKFWIAQGADVNASSTMGLKPIHLAARSGSYECLKILLELNADTSSLCDLGSSALTYALAPSQLRNSEHAKCIEILLNKPLPPLSSLIGSLKGIVIFGREDLLQKLHDRGVNVNSADANGETPLQLADRHQKLLTEKLSALPKENTDLFSMINHQLQSIEKMIKLLNILTKVST